MGLFGRKNKGKKLKMWGHSYKCENCGHNQFNDIKHYPGERFDRVKAVCAKCGSLFAEEGPYHNTKRQ